MTKIVIFGAKGRMGQTLLSCAAQDTGIEIVGRIDLGDDLRSAISACNVVVDFSSHEATADVAECCAANGKAAVIGTTGHSAEERDKITACSARVPMVWSSNYSTGVNALLWLARRATEVLGPQFDIEIVEMHHRHKKDAPSGTALSLARAVAEARQARLAEVIRHGREGMTGERTCSEIGVHAVRGGDVVGDHTVIFAGTGERVELVHKASSRESFARGALRAARWVMGRPPGIYTMQHVLGLE